MKLRVISSHFSLAIIIPTINGALMIADDSQQHEVFLSSSQHLPERNIWGWKENEPVEVDDSGEAMNSQSPEGPMRTKK